MTTQEVGDRLQNLEDKGFIHALVIQSQMPGRRYTFHIEGLGTHSMKTREAETFILGAEAIVRSIQRDQRRREMGDPEIEMTAREISDYLAS